MGWREKGFPGLGTRMDVSLVQDVMARMQASASRGQAGPPPKAAAKGNTCGSREDPMGKFPIGCTLAIEGIPVHASEITFLPALVTCFGRWEVPNRKVIAINIFREANHFRGIGGTYLNSGHMFMRFAEVQYMVEVEDLIMKQEAVVTCDVTGSNRRLRCRVAERDLEGKDFYKRGSIIERARYFDVVFTIQRL